MASGMTSDPAEPAAERRQILGLQLPDFSVLRQRDVQTLIMARNLQKLGIATLSYGAMVYLAQQGASQIQVSLVGVTGYVAALLFGFQGGTIVDSLSKRNAMVFGYAAQAVLCFFVPSVFGTDVVDLVFLAFVVSMLSTITAPAVKASVALIATPAALATVAAMLNLLGSLGTAIGQAFVAPILIKVSGIDAVMYASGIFLGICAIWSLRVPKEATPGSIPEALKDVDWKPAALDLKGIARWVMQTPAVSTIILVGAIVVALGEALGTLIPVYVREVLDADPANSIFIFAPAGIGYLVGAVAAPSLIERFGERRLAFLSFVIAATSMVCLGFVDVLAPILGPISPTRLFELLPNVDLSNEMLAAGFIIMPANFGSTTAGVAVQNYINRRIELVKQGGVFGMEKVIENALVIVAVLTLGAVATIFSSEAAFIAGPFIVLGVVIWLLRYSARAGHFDEPSPQEAVESLWEGRPQHTSG
jgi:MFS family permease